MGNVQAEFRSRLFNFESFQSFVHSFVTVAKSKNPKFTITRFANDLGLKDPSSINKVVRGQRKPGPLLINRLCKYFDLSRDETDYLRNIIDLAKAHTVDERAATVARLQSHFPNRKFRVLESQQFHSISNWYAVAIREMFQLSDRTSKVSWIASRLRFHVARSEIRAALGNLIDLKLLAKDAATGEVEVASGRYSSPVETADEAIKRFHEGSLAIAAKAIREVPLAVREFSSIVLAVQEQDLGAAKVTIANFLEDFSKRFETPKAGDQVYQLNVQFIPLTQKV